MYCGVGTYVSFISVSRMDWWSNSSCFCKYPATSSLGFCVKKQECMNVLYTINIVLVWHVTIYIIIVRMFRPSCHPPNPSWSRYTNSFRWPLTCSTVAVVAFPLKPRSTDSVVSEGIIS